MCEKGRCALLTGPGPPPCAAAGQSPIFASKRAPVLQELLHHRRLQSRQCRPVESGRQLRNRRDPFQRRARQCGARQCGHRGGVSVLGNDHTGARSSQPLRRTVPRSGHQRHREAARPRETSDERDFAVLDRWRGRCVRDAGISRRRSAVSSRAGRFRRKCDREASGQRRGLYRSRRHRSVRRAAESKASGSIWKSRSIFGRREPDGDLQGPGSQRSR